MSRYIICYDIPCNRRRERVAKLLDGYGARVQKSIFEADLDSIMAEHMKTELYDELDLLEDKILIYMLCGACLPKVIRWGPDSDTPCEEIVYIAIILP
jgi:CRISPR-associated protein Cas2